jgi:SAM-dependent methyltransferase
MDFRIKCALQHAFSALPGGRDLNYLAQRYVSRKLPISDSLIEEYRRAAQRHLEQFQKRVGGQPRTVLEIGSGQHLALAILMALAGCEHVQATDVKPNARPALVQDLLQRLGAPSLEELGVSYQAPYAGGAERSFDLVVSDSVLEHVPGAALPALLADCRRSLKPTGICSFTVDYGDHWAQGDRSITRHNYLKFSARQWRFYNPALQFQNRLRHSDYLRLFDEAGFRIVSIETNTLAPPDFRVADDFRRYGPDDLAVVAAYFVLRPK